MSEVGVGWQAADETRRVVLTIGGFESTCGACGKTCLPEEKAHTSKCGYDRHEGCGAVFTHLQAVYPDTEDKVREMRPDLTFLSMFPDAAA